MPEQAKRHNPQRKKRKKKKKKMMMMMMMIMMTTWAVDLELEDSSLGQNCSYLLLWDLFIIHSHSQ